MGVAFGGDQEGREFGVHRSSSVSAALRYTGIVSDDGKTESDRDTGSRVARSSPLSPRPSPRVRALRGPRTGSARAGVHSATARALEPWTPDRAAAPLVRGDGG